MAEQTTTAVSCCAPAEQATWCEPSEKAACCGTSAAGGSCGCVAGRQTTAVAETDIRETVRERYAAAARAVAEQQSSSCGRGPVSTTDAAGAQVFGGSLHDDAQAEGATATAVSASLGCGVPTAVADLHEGETVLDLGSGGGADVLISARRVGPTGHAIGLDMTS